MSNTSLVQMINNIDTRYLTEQEKHQAIARVEATDYAIALFQSAWSWVKQQLIGKRVSFSATKHTHA